MIAPANIADLLPHREPMLMISNVLKVSEEGISCCSNIEKNNPFLEQKLLPSFVALELVAQASGLFLALTASNAPAEEPKAGAIVAVRDMKLSNVKVHQGVSLKVCSTFLGGSLQAAMFEGIVFLDEQEVCAVKVTIASL